MHKGIKAFLSGDWKIAEMCFLEALHVNLEDDVADAIVQASRLPTPAQAQAACKRIVTLQQKQKVNGETRAPDRLRAVITEHEPVRCPASS